MREFCCSAGLLSLSCTAHGRALAQSETDTRSARADARAATITDAEAFVDEVHGYLEMALDGECGRLKRGEGRRLETARDLIAELLTGHASAMELPPDERIELYNAQEFITATLNNDDKSCVLCRREARLGSRVPVTECMTVAERETRARVASEATGKRMRNVCYKGEGNEC